MSDKKYQLSKFLDSKREYQVVVRADTKEEFIQAMADIKPFLDSLEVKVATPPPVAQPVLDNMTSMCKVHGVPMQQAWSKAKNKNYWFHDVAEGRCFGKGALPPRQ